MRNQIDKEINRRSVLARLFALPIGALLASAGATADVQPTQEIAKKPERLVGHGLSNVEVLEIARRNAGVYSESDIAARSTSYPRIGDGLSSALTKSELRNQAKILKLHASNTILELMEVGIYSEQRLVDMKFIYIPAAQEIENAVTSFGDGLIDLEAAQFEVRSTFGRFLSNLEQVPTR